jgi:SAM-dependent methyltransferase
MRRAAFGPFWSLGRRVDARRRTEDLLDRLRYRLDRLTNPLYHPMPGAGDDHGAERAQGTHSRWAAMAPVLDEASPRTALDIGCNSGWFVLALAGRGIPTVGVERDPASYRTVLYAARRSPAGERVGVLAMRLGEETAALLPRADCVLFLSTWHHLVREIGLEAAGRVLGSVWERTGRVLFFDTGESEMPASFGLPAMGPDPGEWVASYLAERCPGGTVEHLGRHQGGWDGPEPVYRSLFAVRR